MLSLNTGMDLERNSLVKPKSLMMFAKWRMSFTHVSVAYISLSAVLLAVIDCRLADHCTGPLIIMKWPEIEPVTCRSTGGSFLCFGGTDWS